MANGDFQRWGIGPTSRVVKSAKPMPTSLCLYCKHFEGVNSSDNATCAAFPNGIPNMFWSAKADHTTPYDGDNGVVFEPYA